MCRSPRSRRLSIAGPATRSTWPGRRRRSGPGRVPDRVGDRRLRSDLLPWPRRASDLRLDRVRRICRRHGRGPGREPNAVPGFRNGTHYPIWGTAVGWREGQRGCHSGCGSGFGVVRGGCRRTPPLFAGRRARAPRRARRAVRTGRRGCGCSAGDGRAGVSTPGTHRPAWLPRAVTPSLVGTNDGARSGRQPAPATSCRRCTRSAATIDDALTRPRAPRTRRLVRGARGRVFPATRLAADLVHLPDELAGVSPAVTRHTWSERTNRCLRPAHETGHCLALPHPPDPSLVEPRYPSAYRVSPGRGGSVSRSEFHGG